MSKSLEADTFETPLRISTSNMRSKSAPIVPRAQRQGLPLKLIFNFLNFELPMPLSDIEKAAVLLIALGPERSQRILNQLGADELLPIIEAMQKMRHIDETTRKEALVDIADWLDDQTTDKTPTSDSAISLLNAMGPYLPEAPDTKKIDWSRAGFNFDPPNEPPPKLPGTHPPNDDDPPLPGSRR
jgi:hypothetical protein